MRNRSLIASAVLVCVFYGLAMGALPGEDYKTLSKHYGFGEIEIIKLEQDIQNIVVGDFNNDGLNDIAVVNNYNSRIDILLQNKSSVETESEYVETRPEDVDINILGENHKYTKNQVLVNVKMHNMATGDFNSDGLLDFAFYGDPTGLYIILQKKDPDSKDGKLSWESWEKIKIDDGLTYSNTLICDDLNKDGKSDLILGAKQAVYIIMQDAENKLAKPAKYPATENVLWVKTGDVNGDAIKDLIVITNTVENNTSVRLGTGNGNFGPVKQFTIERPIALEFANIDDSGELIFSVERQSGRLVCYKYKPGKENITEEDEIDLTIYPMLSSEEAYNRDMAIGDFDGDGLDDIVISEPDSAEITVYGQSITGGLIQPKKFPAYSSIKSIFALDVDKAMKYDLGILSVSEKSLGISSYVNSRFEFPTTVKIQGEPIGAVPALIDGDDTIDSFYLYRDSNDIRYLEVIYNFAGKEQKDAGLKLEIKGLQSTPDGMLPIDIDQDGLMDVIIFISQYVSPVVVRQSENGKFEILASSAMGMSVLEKVKLSGTSFANVSGDSKVELLAAYGNFARSIILKNGKWEVLDQYNARDAATNIDCVLAYDLYKDGKPEILLFDGKRGVMQVLKLDDDNTYRFHREYEIGKWQFKKIQPFNAANQSCLILFDGDKFAKLTLKSNKAELEQMFNYETKIKDGRYGRIVIGDLNGKGLKDLALVDYNKNNIEILAIDKTLDPAPAFRFKVFEEKSYQRPGGGPSIEPRELLIADVTGDGQNDLIVIVHDRIIIYPQDF